MPMWSFRKPRDTHLPISYDFIGTLQQLESKWASAAWQYTSFLLRKLRIQAMTWWLLVDRRASVCAAPGQPPCPGPWVPRHPLPASELHVCLLIANDKKQYSLAFTQASCLSEEHPCDRVHPCEASSFTMYRAKLSSPAAWPWPFVGHNHHGVNVFLI